MAGKSHFVARCKNSHARVGARLVGRRKNKGGFREVELAGEVLHVLIAQSNAILEDTERVAGKRALVLSENVDDAERVSCHEAIIAPARDRFFAMTRSLSISKSVSLAATRNTQTGSWASAVGPHHHDGCRRHHRHARSVVSAVVVAIGGYDAAAHGNNTDRNQ